MNNKLFLFPVRLNMFDGEADDGSNAAGSETIVNGVQSQEQEPIVLYGVQPDVVQEAQAVVTEPDVKPITFNSQTELDAMIGGRLAAERKKYQGFDEKVKAYDPIIESLKLIHGTDNVEEIYKKIEEDRIEKLAEDAGVSFETAQEMYNDKKELSQYKTKEQVEAAAKAEADRDTRVNALFTAAEALKKEEGFENFDLATEVQNNPDFLALINQGKDLKQAYRMANVDKLMVQVASKVKENTVSSIQAGTKRITELGTQPAGQKIIVKSDPNNLNFNDIDRINEAVRRGEKVSFG